MLKRLAVLFAFAIGTVSIAHATQISGFFSANGTDTFTSSTITFNPNGAPGNPNNSIVVGAIGGTFSSYLSDGNLITFLPGALPYSLGFNTPPLGTFPLGYVPNFFTVTGGGVTFSFNLTDYTVGNSGVGCTSGSTCLAATGDGFFTSSDPTLTQSGPATFTFTSQYVAGQPSATLTSFSASSSAPAVPNVPEPASLALVGSGLLGLVGMARRKLSV